jgi:hypothetical protein
MAIVSESFAIAPPSRLRGACRHRIEEPGA